MNINLVNEATVYLRNSKTQQQQTKYNLNVSYYIYFSYYGNNDNDNDNDNDIKYKYTDSSLLFTNLKITLGTKKLFCSLFILLVLA